MEYYSIELLEFFYYLLFTAGISVPLKEQKNNASFQDPLSLEGNSHGLGGGAEEPREDPTPPSA